MGEGVIDSSDQMLPAVVSEGDARAELQNFCKIAAALHTSSARLPELSGVEIAGLSLPVRGVLGGDHILYVDFSQRYDLPGRIAEAERSSQWEVARELRDCAHRVGVLLVDVSGHRATDAAIAAMVHQAFLLGTYYELDRFGRITTRLFEHLNQRFYETTAVSKYFTMIYGEVSTEGRLRFICAGHPRPLVYSRQYRSFVTVPKDRMVSFPPVGMFPSEGKFAEGSQRKLLRTKPGYLVNEIQLLASGDLVLLYTDGLSELSSGRYIAQRLEGLIGEVVDLPAVEIAATVSADVLQSLDREDDVSLVVIKRSGP